MKKKVNKYQDGTVLGAAAGASTAGSDLLYSYPSRPDATYKNINNQWLINLGEQTGNNFIPINDPTSSRTEELNKNAVALNPMLTQLTNNIYTQEFGNIGGIGLGAISAASNAMEGLPASVPSNYFDTYLTDLKGLENSIKSGYNPVNSKWLPHSSIEGGNKTLAYGHKLTGDEIQKGYISMGSDKLYFNKGITEEQAKKLEEHDVKKHQKIAKSKLDAKYGKGAYDKLDEGSKIILTDFVYNIGPGVFDSKSKKGFPKFIDALIRGDKEEMLNQYSRSSKGKPLKGRNTWTEKMINSLESGGRMTNVGIMNDDKDKKKKNKKDSYKPANVGENYGGLNIVLANGKPTVVAPEGSDKKTKELYNKFNKEYLHTMKKNRLLGKDEIYHMYGNAPESNIYSDEDAIQVLNSKFSPEENQKFQATLGWLRENPYEKMPPLKKLDEVRTNIYPNITGEDNRLHIPIAGVNLNPVTQEVNTYAEGATMVVENPIQGISKPEDKKPPSKMKNLSENTIKFWNVLSEKFNLSDSDINSAFRKGEGSKHNIGEAIDISPKHTQVYNWLLNSKEGLELMVQYDMGIIDETDPALKKKYKSTGDHFHIGTDPYYANISKQRLASFDEGIDEMRSYKELHQGHLIELDKLPQQQKQAIAALPKIVQFDLLDRMYNKTLTNPKEIQKQIDVAVKKKNTYVDKLDTTLPVPKGTPRFGQGHLFKEYGGMLYGGNNPYAYGGLIEYPNDGNGFYESPVYTGGQLFNNDNFIMTKMKGDGTIKQKEISEKKFNRLQKKYTNQGNEYNDNFNNDYTTINRWGNKSVSGINPEPTPGLFSGSFGFPQNTGLGISGGGVPSFATYGGNIYSAKNIPLNYSKFGGMINKYAYGSYLGGSGAGSETDPWSDIGTLQTKPAQTIDTGVSSGELAPYAGMQKQESQGMDMGQMGQYAAAAGTLASGLTNVANKEDATVEDYIDVAQDTVATAIPIAGLFHGASEMGTDLAASWAPEGQEEQHAMMSERLFQPHTWITGDENSLFAELGWTGEQPDKAVTGTAMSGEDYLRYGGNIHQTNSNMIVNPNYAYQHNLWKQSLNSNPIWSNVQFMDPQMQTKYLQGLTKTDPKIKGMVADKIAYDPDTIDPVTGLPGTTLDYWKEPNKKIQGTSPAVPAPTKAPYQPVFKDPYGNPLPVETYGRPEGDIDYAYPQWLDVEANTLTKQKERADVEARKQSNIKTIKTLSPQQLEEAKAMGLTADEYLAGAASKNIMFSGDAKYRMYGGNIHQIDPNMTSYAGPGFNSNNPNDYYNPQGRGRGRGLGNKFPWQRQGDGSRYDPLIMDEAEWNAHPTKFVNTKGTKVPVDFSAEYPAPYSGVTQYGNQKVPTGISGSNHVFNIPGKAHQDQMSYKEYYPKAYEQWKASQGNIHQEFASGGNMFTNGGFGMNTMNELPVTEFKAGGTHDQNPLGGIPQGRGANGLVNLVEEGELKIPDPRDPTGQQKFVISAQKDMKITKELAEENDLPKKYVGKTVRNVADAILRKGSKRDGDAIEENSKRLEIYGLINAHETLTAQKEAEKQAEFENRLTSLGEEFPEYMQALTSQGQPQSQPMQQSVPQEMSMARYGGNIHQTRPNMSVPNQIAPFATEGDYINWLGTQSPSTAETDYDYRTNLAGTVGDLTDNETGPKNKEVKINPELKDTEDLYRKQSWGNLAAQAAPALVNLGMGLFSKPREYNLGRASSPTLARTDIGQELRELGYEHASIADKVAAAGGSPGNYLSNMQNLASTLMKRRSATHAKKQEMDKQISNQEAALRARADAINVGQKSKEELLKAQGEAAITQQLLTGISQVGQFAKSMEADRLAADYNTLYSDKYKYHYLKPWEKAPTDKG